MTDIYVNTGTTFQQPYNARQPANGRVPANAQLTARQPRNAQNPFTYQNRSPFTYRNPSAAQQPYIANAQQPYPYIANAQQPYIANSQTPFTYQNRQPVNGQNPYQANAQQPYIANARQPFTYQARYPANAQTPYIANARNPFTYQARSPFTYRVPYIANGQNPYIANAQQPYIANARQPFIYQTTYNASGSYQVPFTYQVTYNATGTAPAIGTQPGATTEINNTFNQTSTGTSLWVYKTTSTIISATYLTARLQLFITTPTTFGVSVKFLTGGYTNRSAPSWYTTWGAYYTMFYATIGSAPNSYKLINDVTTTEEGFNGTSSHTTAFSSNPDATYSINGTTQTYTWPTSNGYTAGYQLQTSVSQQYGGSPSVFVSNDHTLKLQKTGYPEFTFTTIDTDYEVLVFNTGGSDGGCPLCCVHDSMLIATGDDMKSIYDIQIGDKVVSHNFETGQDELTEVTDIIIVDRDVDYKVNDLIMTEDHPVYLEGGRKASVNPEATLLNYKQEVDQLVVGDKMMKLDGTLEEIVSIERHEGTHKNFAVQTKYNNFYANGHLVDSVIDRGVE